MRTRTRILILGAVLAVVFIITLWPQQQVAQGQQATAAAPCREPYDPLEPTPVTTPRKLLLGIRQANQGENDWERGLSASEKEFLRHIGQMLAQEDEPVSMSQQHRPRAFAPMVHMNPTYCFLNYPPWVYICR